ncbi:hypothetical protein E3N88_34714 [Mikania micrantha]|uniref:Protein FAR1-RELATED SEQUENCE n=1 Tax=Mikania micrantha TaxID=192012 RepID=A0A5N6LYY2_9ASTR|nr:hypothetical protein E3N88_34714 [Mikania micrantha]
MDSTLDLNTFDSLIASYNEESFVALEIEVYPMNDDPIITVDEEHVYVPNLPLLREECYEIPSNGGCDVKPTVGATYGSWSDVLRMYKNYAECSSFSTTSRCESSNASLKVNSSGANTLVQFILCYDTSIESQRYMQRLAEVNRIVRIPDDYISKRWMKDVLPKRIFEIQYCYDVDNSSESLLRNEIFGLISNCVDSLQNDYDGLAVLANIVRELSSNQSSDPVDSISKFSNVEDIQNLVGGSLDVDLQCSNPQGIRNKGCGKSRHLIGAGEKAVDKSLRTPRRCRTCQKYVTGHDSRNCKKKRTEVVDVTDE